MWLKVGNIHTVVTRCSVEERAWLDNFLSFEDGKARFFRGRSSGGEVPRVKMLNPVTNVFSTGLLALVQKEAEGNHEVELIDQRTPPVAAGQEQPLPDWLRDYQADAVAAVERRKRGILWMPTGAGKTETIIALAMRMPCRWLFLVNSKDLLHQTAERYEKRAGRKAGVFGDGECDLDSDFVVASFQTLHRGLTSTDGLRRGVCLQLLHGAQGMVVDEVHTLPADSYLLVANETPNAYYRVGMSGTPLARGDRRSLLAIATCGPVIFRLRAEKLIAEGVLARPHVRFVDVSQDVHTSFELGDEYTWPNVYKQLVVESSLRNQVVSSMVRAAAKPCMLFIKDIAHGKALEQLLRRRGFKVSFAHGSDSSESRAGMIKRLEAGELEVLISSVIFQQGLDVPSLASIVVASGGKSVIATIQRAGRGMRTDGGKKADFEVWDVMDKGCPMLERHARARMRAYVSEGYETVVGQQVQKDIL